jgi:hypothetical protein
LEILVGAVGIVVTKLRKVREQCGNEFDLWSRRDGIVPLASLILLVAFFPPVLG